MYNGGTLMAAIEKLLKSPEAYMLDQQQYADIKILRDEASKLCENNKLEEAEEIYIEIRNIVWEGAPTRD
jgi:hypothetical protein